MFSIVILLVHVYTNFVQAVTSSNIRVEYVLRRSRVFDVSGGFDLPDPQGWLTHLTFREYSSYLGNVQLGHRKQSELLISEGLVINILENFVNSLNCGLDEVCFAIGRQFLTLFSTIQHTKTGVSSTNVARVGDIKSRHTGDNLDGRWGCW
jgi:hypothetical protein